MACIQITRIQNPMTVEMVLTDTKSYDSWNGIEMAHSIQLWKVQAIYFFLIKFCFYTKEITLHPKKITLHTCIYNDKYPGPIWDILCQEILGVGDKPIFVIVLIAFFW